MSPMPVWWENREKKLATPYVVVEYGHAWTDPDPSYIDADRVYECHDQPLCEVQRINTHPVHHVERVVTYGPWLPLTPRSRHE